MLPLVAVVWLALAWALTQYGAPLLPRALASRLTLQSFLSLVLVLAAGIGLTLSFKLIAAPREALGLTRPSATALLVGLLLAPAVLTAGLYVGFELALPTLLEEIARGGRQAAQQNTGAFGRELVQAHVVTTLVWATLITPVAEELLFRGAVWSSVARLTRPPASSPLGLPEGLLDPSLSARAYRGLGRWLRDGGIATLATTALFAWMHADQQGGAGIVRVVQTACLGLGLGMLRHASGSVLPAILLHGLYNALSVAKLRRWIAGEIWPHPLPIPLLLWQLAAAASILLLVVAAARAIRARAVRAAPPVATDD